MKTQRKKTIVNALVAACCLVSLTTLCQNRARPTAALKVPRDCSVAGNGQAEPYTATGYAEEIRHDKTGILLVFVPAGKFMMGSRLSPDELEKFTGESSLEERIIDGKKVEVNTYTFEEPCHVVSIPKPFYIAKYEEKNSEYERFVQEANYDGGNEKGNQYLSHITGKREAAQPDYPAIWVNWNHAQAFCQWAGLRLPSEAEWEYAFRAKTETVFFWGDDLRKGEDYANACLAFPGRPEATEHVGMKAPNAWGIYDMAGNVSEWCRDTWHDSYRGAPTNGAAWVVDGDTQTRVVRGGSWFDLITGLRSSERVRHAVVETSAMIGFRVVLDLDR